MRTFCYLLLSALLTAAATSSALARAALIVPAVFRGQLPCADCSGITVTLRLNADRTYSERNVYIGRSTSYVERGTWTYDTASGILTLKPSSGSAQLWRGGNDGFRMLDASGNLIAPVSSDILTRVTSAPPNPALEGTVWTLVTLEGANVTVPAGRSAPTMTLSAQDSRVTGSGGCNRFTGEFTTTASGVLTFGGIGSTRMFCADDMNTENRFFNVLEKVRGYRITSATLHLVAADGATLATLTAGP